MPDVPDKSKYLFALCIIGAAALLSCVPLSSPVNQEQFLIKRVGSGGDTIAPFGGLRLCFTAPVRYPDSVGFIFTPACGDFQVLFNKTADTVTLVFSAPLPGSTAYAVSLASEVESVNGTLLYPSDGTMRIRTWPIEREPNDDRTLADSFTGTAFGSIANANDTDWFQVADAAARTFYLQSTGSESLFSVRDAQGRIKSVSRFAAAETLAVPTSFTPPLYLVVCAFGRSNGGWYKLGAVR